MPTTIVKWVSGKQFVGMDSNQHAVVISGDEDPSGVRPSQLLLLSLASCTAYDVVEILEKKRKPLSRLEIVADGEHASEAPWPFQKIHLTYRLRGKDLTEKAVEQAIELSEQKYCSVSATIRGVTQITTEYEILANDP
jgi:putative redox protein